MSLSLFRTADNKIQLGEILPEGSTRLVQLPENPTMGEVLWAWPAASGNFWEALKRTCEMFRNSDFIELLDAAKANRQSLK